MSTKIEWANETWNPIVGCTKVSPGCDHCYAERMATRLRSMSKKWDNAGRNIFHMSAMGQYSEVISDDNKWTGKTAFNNETILKPLRWRNPRRIFVCSMGDLFHESVPLEWIDKVMVIAALMPKHTFMILTKRPERMKDYFFEDKNKLIERWESACYDIGISDKHDDIDMPPCWVFNRAQDEWPLKNLWLGVTTENQEQADKRIPILLQIPAAKRFISVEPMLGPIDLTDIQIGNQLANVLSGVGDISPLMHTIDWVICGGESGPRARPMHPHWVRLLRDLCYVTKARFTFKQWGEWIQLDKKHAMIEGEIVLGIDGKEYIMAGDHLKPVIMKKVGKKASGRELEGKIYDYYPA